MPQNNVLVHKSLAHPGWWVILLNGEVHSLYPTQEEADSAAGKLAYRLGCDWAVAGLDGKIRKKNSGGSDPRNIKG